MVDKQLDTLTADRTAVGGLKGGLYFQGWTEGAPKGAARPAERLPCAYRRTQAVLALHCPWQRGEPVRPPSCNTPHGICSILCPVPRPLPPPPHQAVRRCGTRWTLRAAPACCPPTPPTLKCSGWRRARARWAAPCPARTTRAWRPCSRPPSTAPSGEATHVPGWGPGCIGRMLRPVVQADHHRAGLDGRAGHDPQQLRPTGVSAHTPTPARPCCSFEGPACDVDVDECARGLDDCDGRCAHTRLLAWQRAIRARGALRPCSASRAQVALRARAAGFARSIRQRHTIPPWQASNSLSQVAAAVSPARPCPPAAQSTLRA